MLPVWKHKQEWSQAYAIMLGSTMGRNVQRGRERQMAQCNAVQ